MCGPTTDPSFRTQPEPVPPPGRPLWLWGEALRRHWAEALGATRASLYLLDTKPLPVVGYTRNKSRSDFAATAAYGVCASRHLKYFGYQRVLLCTPAGVPVAYDLVPASTDERVAGEQVPDWVWQARILGDKGFIGADWQQGYRETRGLAILTPARTHQRPARPAAVQRWLNLLRERIEGAFHEVQNTGRYLEHLTCRTLRGLSTHDPNTIPRRNPRPSRGKAISQDVWNDNATRTSISYHGFVSFSGIRYWQIHPDNDDHQGLTTCCKAV